MGRRVIWIVLDSVGIGAEPDADNFGDVGSDTLGHIIKTFPNVDFVNMRRLGLYNIEGTSFRNDKTGDVIGCYGKGQEMSNGKDTTTGHLEMIGIYTKNPFPTYPDGFPQEIIDEFIEKTGCGGIYGNKVASGVPIIAEYGDEHMRTGYPIIYTSADSVFQIAASEEKVGLDQLYRMCEIARDILQGEHGVGRVIARPFVTKGDGYERTANRRDYSLKPSRHNILCHLQEAGLTVAAVGKISDIFNGVGISTEVHTSSNSDGMAKTREYMKTVDSGLIFTNLVDFDMKYGHRRDAEGYKNALLEFDEWLGETMKELSDEDIIIIDADHGCDPTFKGSDHTREYVPILVYGKKLKRNVNLGCRSTFADIGKTVEEYLLGYLVEDSETVGTSFLSDIVQ
ncbi:MAG: phosphopentomutase [Wujia sp.]